LTDSTRLLQTAFPAVARPDARILILGSLPGGESLRLGQYYAKAQNRFWWIMGELLGFGLDQPYEDRCARLMEGGFALWDVCAAAERPGSLDAAIVPSSVVANHFAAFLKEHRRVRLIAFNGQTAAKLYVRFVLGGLPADLAALPRVTLPSTSPANAGMPATAKLAAWRAGLIAPSRANA
jgi:hypoxanthine-DNA glycosylase